MLLNMTGTACVRAAAKHDKRHTKEFDCLQEQLGVRNLPLDIRRFSSGFVEGVLNAI